LQRGTFGIVLLLEFSYSLFFTDYGYLESWRNKNPTYSTSGNCKFLENFS